MTDPDATDGGYRWTCPCCGNVRVNKSERGWGKQNAIAALRAHIYASDGDGHGPTNELPPEAESIDLAAYVDEVE